MLDATYAHHARVSTVGLWSVWAMDEPQELQLGMSWARAFRVVVHHDAGDIAVYAVHLPSVRPGDTADRDAAVNELAALVAADRSRAGRVALALWSSEPGPAAELSDRRRHRAPPRDGAR